MNHAELKGHERVFLVRHGDVAVLRIDRRSCARSGVGRGRRAPRGDDTVAGVSGRQARPAYVTGTGATRGAGGAGGG